MPNREELWRLVARGHGDDERGRRVMSELWQSLRDACAEQTTAGFEEAMSLANDSIGGFGVEFMRMRLTHPNAPRDAIATIQYVNTGDTYNATLCFVMRWNRKTVRRFEVTSWGDLVEAAQRRFPRGEWET